MHPKSVILEDAHAVLQSSFLSDLRKLGTLVSKRGSSLEDYEKSCKEASILVASGGSKIDKAYFDRLPNLKLITVFGVGYDGVDVKEAKKRGVLVTHTPAVMKDDVADMAMALLLNCTRELIEAHKFIERGDWMQASRPLMVPLTQMKVGICGLGRIGEEIALRLKAFRCEIAYFATHKHEDVPYQYFDNLENLASWAQALIVIMPLTDKTYHMIDSKILKALGPQGYLINVARGKIVDTEALIYALDHKEIRGCGLDVLEQEPQIPPASLLNKPNVVLTPHAGSATLGSRNAMAQLVLENIKSYLEKGEVLTSVPELKKA